MNTRYLKGKLSGFALFVHGLLQTVFFLSCFQCFFGIYETPMWTIYLFENRFCTNNDAYISCQCQGGISSLVYKKQFKNQIYVPYLRDYCLYNNSTIFVFNVSRLIVEILILQIGIHSKMIIPMNGYGKTS